MAERHILFLDATHLTAFRWQRNSVEQEAEFDCDAAGIAAFIGYLSARRGDLYYLLADVAEEGFQLEDIPHVGGRDRIAIVKRKLAQYHHDTRLAVALSQGRRSGGRRDETVLFAALTRPQHLGPWLQALSQEEAALVGLFSLPQMVETLAASVHTLPRCLVITLTRSGLRQTYLTQGHLRLSRLTRLTDNTVEQVAAVCMIEAAKIHRYLAAQPEGDDGLPLPVLLFAHADELAAFRECCRDTQALHFQYLDLSDTARRLGFQSSLTDSHCETLLAHLLVKRTPRDQFAQSDDRRIYRLGKLRNALLAGAAGLCFGCLLFAADQLVAAWKLDERTDGLLRQTEADNRRHQAALEALPSVPLGTDDLRLLVGRYEELQKRTVGPGPLLHRLGQALNDFPSVELDRLTWTLVERMEDLATAGDKPIVPATLPLEHRGPFAVVEVLARLPNTLANAPRGQLTVIDNLARRLRNSPEIQVLVLSRSFDVASDKPLKNTADPPAPEAPKFVLRMAQPL